MRAANEKRDELSKVSKLDVVKSNEKLKQQSNIGIPRCLSDDDLDHAICLLRLLEHLPLLSENYESVQDVQTRRQLETIHQNHLELAESAGRILKLANKRQ